MKRIFWIGLALVGVLALWQVYRLYQRVAAPGIFLGKETAILYVETGTTFDELHLELLDSGWIKDKPMLQILAEKKGITENLRPGRYRLRNHMSLNAFVNMLRGGLQEPVQLVIRPERTFTEILPFLDRQLQPSKEELGEALRNDSLLALAGLNREQAVLMVIPNTYEVWWTVSAEGFAERMLNEYQDFWNGQRREKAEELGLTPAGVGILASIVQQETNKREEMSTIAGVYVNRLQRGMLLQADPTVKFAAGCPGLRRVLSRHLKIDSPYNTYKYQGLPPGPIVMPEPFVIDAVLDAEDHEYIFFCARADLSGYHAFARTNAEHSRNAREYRRALNKRRIYQ